MTPKFTLKRMNGELIVTENGKPKVFASLIEALKHICGVRR